MDREKAMDKIKKLLALSGSDNDNESHVALAMAQKLMMEFKIQEKELAEGEDKKCVTKKTSFYFTRGNVNTYVSDLADIISENFCCINFFSYRRGTRKNFISFMGLEDDVALCEEAMVTAMNAISAGYNRVWKELQKRYDVSYIPTSVWNPAKTGYIRGYLSGLSAVFEEQRSAHQEWGLVLVVPPEAEEYKANLEGITLNRPNAISYNYYNEGYEDGKKFNMNKKLNNPSGYFLED